jgi:cytochrome c2
MSDGLASYARWVWLVGTIVFASVSYLAVNQTADLVQRGKVAKALTAGDAGKAAPIFRKYGCSGCHTIPGIPGADGQVGGSLADLSKRVYIGGVLTNTPDHLVSWIVSPEQFSPRTAMPATGISNAEARDLAAYLYGR